MLILFVGAGGFIGATLRYLVGTWVNSVSGSDGFPYGTLAVNAIGCFVIGIIAGTAEARQPLSTEAQAFLVIGVLGGFTTFSAFGIDTIKLFRDGAYLASGTNVVLQIVLGLTAVGLGLSLVNWIHRFQSS